MTDPIFLAAILAVCCGVLLVAFLPSSSPKTSATGVGGSFSGVPIGGDYSLIDHTGNVATQDNYPGQYKFIYFGFTFCPAICPTELQKMIAALDSLDPQKSTKVQPIFITIDPDRDTVDVMRDYVALFDKRLVGLTGTSEQIKAAADAFRVYFAKVENEEYGEYTMDHSSYIYLMSPENDLLNIYKISDDVSAIINDLNARLGE